MASSSQNTTFPMNGLAPMIAIKLSGSNYIYWHKQMLPILSYQHLLPHVDGSQIAPPPTITKNDKEVDNPEYFSWIHAEQQAIITINASLTEEALAVTVGLTTAHDIWVSLETAFCNTSVERVQNLRDNLRILKKGDKTVAEFGREFKAICDQLHAVGHPVDTMDQLHWFLCGLGKSFESFSTNMRSTRPIPTFVDLLASAESHELFIKNLHSEPAPPSVAFVAQSARPTNQQQHRGNNMSQSHMKIEDIYNDALAIYHVSYDYAIKFGDVRKCGFAWKVAGEALCSFHESKTPGRSISFKMNVLSKFI
ncbi:hypothetical protein Hanom_Chr10g00964211 [Helianthus anomalus]